MTRWSTSTLGEVVTYERGLTYSKADEVPFSQNGVLRANNIDLGTKSLDLTDIRYIADTVQVPPAKKVRRGSLLICTASGSRSHLGKVALIDADYDLAFGGFMGLITAGPDLDGRFLYYLMTSESFQEKLESLAGGTNINNLKFKDIADFPVPLPPLDEQRRIVAVLDEAFAAIATATVNAEKNLANARELFDATVGAWCATIDAPKRSLSEACERVTVGHVGTTSPHYRATGIPFLRTQNVGRGGIRLDELVYITPEFHRNLGKSSLKAGDILISRVVTDRMNVGIVPPSLGEANCANVICVRPGMGMDPRYLSYLIRADQSQRDLLGQRKGSAQQVVNTSVLKNWRVPVPFLNLQREMVDRLDAESLLIDALSAAYEEKLLELTRLKQSILRRAFSGELTEREPLAA